MSKKDWGDLAKEMEETFASVFFLGVATLLGVFAGVFAMAYYTIHIDASAYGMITFSLLAASVTAGFTATVFNEYLVMGWVLDDVELVPVFEEEMYD